MFDKYGNDLDYWYCCPVCGKSLLPSCVHCTKHKKVQLVKSLHNKEYYKQIAFDQHRYTSSGLDIVIEEEIKTNPLYDPSEYEISHTPPQKPIANIYTKPQNTNVPKCPTCQSTNIKKISTAKKATHGIMFGIFSKTAFSQFECCNCGYKW